MSCVELSAVNGPRNTGRLFSQLAQLIRSDREPSARGVLVVCCQQRYIPLVVGDKEKKKSLNRLAIILPIVIFVVLALVLVAVLLCCRYGLFRRKVKCPPAVRKNCALCGRLCVCVCFHQIVKDRFLDWPPEVNKRHNNALQQKSNKRTVRGGDGDLWAENGGIDNVAVLDDSDMRREKELDDVDGVSISAVMHGAFFCHVSGTCFCDVSGETRSLPPRLLYGF